MKRRRWDRRRDPAGSNCQKDEKTGVQAKEKTGSPHLKHLDISPRCKRLFGGKGKIETLFIAGENRKENHRPKGGSTEAVLEHKKYPPESKKN